jgi:hypothetical protein
MRVMTKHEFRRGLEYLNMSQGQAARFLGVSLRSVHVGPMVQ